MDPREIYRYAFRSLVILIAIVLISFIFNLIGISGFNFVIAFFLIPIVFGLAFAPEITITILATAIVSGIFQRPQTIREEIKSFFQTYVNVIKWFAFFLLIIFTFLATIPFRENPGTFFALIVVVPAIIFSSKLIGLQGNWGNWIIFVFLILIAIISVLKLIPNKIYQPGIDRIVTIIHSELPKERKFQSESGNMITEIQELNKTNLDSKLRKELEKIKLKLEKGTLISELTDNETEILEKAREISLSEKIIFVLIQIFLITLAIIFWRKNKTICFIIFLIIVLFFFGEKIWEAIPKEIKNIPTVVSKEIFIDAVDSIKKIPSSPMPKTQPTLPDKWHYGWNFEKAQQRAGNTPVKVLANGEYEMTPANFEYSLDGGETFQKKQFFSVTGNANNRFTVEVPEANSPVQGFMIYKRR